MSIAKACSYSFSLLSLIEPLALSSDDEHISSSGLSFRAALCFRLETLHDYFLGGCLLFFGFNSLSGALETFEFFDFLDPFEF